MISTIGLLFLICATASGVLAIDGTKMEGQASLSANRKAKYIEAELNRLFKESMECEKQETLDGTTPISGDYLLPDERASIEKKKVVLQKSLDKLNERQEIEAEKQQARIRDRENEEAETGKKKRGRKLAQPTTALSPDAKVNPTDPTSQIMSTTHGFIQGFNGQIVVTEDQFIIAAALTDDQNDKNQFQPMMEEVNQLLESVPKEEQPQVILADSGYCSTQNVLFETPDGPKFYFATSKERKMQESGVDEAFLTRLDELCRTVPGMCAATTAELASIGTGVWNTFLNRERPATQQEVCWAIMGARVRSPTGRELYRKRKIMPEPVFGNIKFNMRFRRFSLKGKDKCQGEFCLAAICHNIIKIKNNNLLKKLQSFVKLKSISSDKGGIFRKSSHFWYDWRAFFTHFLARNFMNRCQFFTV